MPSPVRRMNMTTAAATTRVITMIFTLPSRLKLCHAAEISPLGLRPVSWYTASQII